MLVKSLKLMLLPTKINYVDEKLCRGNAIFSPVKALRLKAQGVSQVIDLRSSHDIISEALKLLERLYCKLLKIDYVNSLFYSSSANNVPEKKYFDDLNKQIGDKKTYIHCHYGLHRTGMAVAMYQKNKNLPKDTVIKQLLTNEWNNDKVMKTLKDFLKTYFAK